MTERKWNFKVDSIAVLFLHSISKTSKFSLHYRSIWNRHEMNTSLPTWLQHSFIHFALYLHIHTILLCSSSLNSVINSTACGFSFVQIFYLNLSGYYNKSLFIKENMKERMLIILNERLNFLKMLLHTRSTRKERRF
jgi:hypothetical protein